MKLLVPAMQIGAAVLAGVSPLAHGEDSGTGAIEEIVITAQKRTERLSDVPVAASVVSTDLLANANATDISDLNKLVPSVNLNGSFNGRVPLGVRGISTVVGEGVVGFSSGVAVMIDGVPIPSDSIAANDLEDVAQIEVLKGPQGTLGGRTAAAGVINMVTRGPKWDWSESASTVVTSDGERRFSGFVTGPLSSAVAMSLSGYANHLDFPIRNLATGDYSNKGGSGARAKLLFRPTENLDVTLVGHVAQSVSHGENFVYTYVTPGSTLLFPGSPLTQAKLLPGIIANLDNQSYNSPVTDSGAQIHDADGSLNIDYRIGDYTLSSTTAYQRETQRNRQDLFAVAEYFWQDLTGGSAPPFYNYFTQWETNHQTSEELKIVSPADRPFSFVGGLFFSDTSIDELVKRDLVPALENVHVVPTTKTYDAYLRTTWKMTPDMTLVTGLRANNDHIGYTYDQIAYTPQTAHYSSGSTSSTNLVGDIALQRTLMPGMMAYGSYSRGYSPEAYNTTFVLASNDPLQPVGTEHVDSFELGLKGSLLDGRLGVDAALFDTIYSNYQIETFQSLPGYISPPTILMAAGKAQTRGLEFNTRLAATSLLNLTFNAAYVDSKWQDYRNALCYQGQTAAQGCVTDAATGISVQDVSGQVMPNAPKFKANITAEQKLMLPAAAFDLAFDGSYAYRTSAQMLPDENPQAILPGYGLVNIGISALGHQGHFRLRLFVNNLLDKHYVVDMEDFWSSVWVANTVVSQPARDSNRYAGLRFDVNY